MSLRKVARWLRDKTTKVSGPMDNSDYCWACAMGRCGAQYVRACRCCRTVHMC